MKQTCETCLSSKDAPCEGCVQLSCGLRSRWAPMMDYVPKTISGRAVAEIRRMAWFSEISVAEERDRIGISRSVFSSWQVGNCTPGGGMLASMAEHGYDVHYILTGVRKWRQNEQEKKA